MSNLREAPESTFEVRLVEVVLVSSQRTKTASTNLTLKVISEAPPGILEGTISFPKVNLGSAKRISWASARFSEVLYIRPFEAAKGPSGRGFRADSRGLW